MRALVVREQNLVVESIGMIRRQMPFALRGLDTDNDSVFINETLQLTAASSSSIGPGNWPHTMPAASLRRGRPTISACFSRARDGVANLENPPFPRRKKSATHWGCRAVLKPEI